MTRSVSNTSFLVGALIVALAFAAVTSNAPHLHAQSTSPTVALHAKADASASGPLFDELARMDSVLFDASFVSCNAQVATAIFSDDIEFYHDKGGAAFGEQVRENTRNLTKGCPATRGVRRELVAGSLRVYPVKDFGAVQMGEHRFVERGAPTSTVARFVHLWKRTDAGWRVTRVLSLDHQPTPAGSR